jgi:hypothetical protein
VRILSLGLALPDSQVDNYDWGSALSFFDYDAIVVDPALAVSKMVEGLTGEGGSYQTYTEEPVVDGPSTATGVGLAELLRRRREETERLLGRGGLVVCFAYPDVPHPRVTGFTGCHRYYWLPAPPGCDYGRNFVKPATGTEVRVTDYESPFAEFLERYRSNVVYRAAFAEGPDGFGAHARVIGRSPGGAAIALDLRVGEGRVVFLPVLAERLSMVERSMIATSIVGGVRNALLLASEGPRPAWLSRYPLPGSEAAEERVAKAEARVEAAETELEEARVEFRGIDRYQRLLWQEGKYGLDLPVRDALALLGFTSFARADDPAAFLYDDDHVFVEIQGGRDSIGMDVHYRLRQRLEQKIAGEGKRVKGLVVINGYRDRAVEERPRQYEESLRVAAESMRYCVVEASTLFQAVRAATAGESETVKAFCKRLIETEGVLAPEGGLEEGGEHANE